MCATLPPAAYGTASKSAIISISMKQKRTLGFADIGLIAILLALCVIIAAGILLWANARENNKQKTQELCVETVSYTHLTLPTIYSV